MRDAAPVTRLDRRKARTRAALTAAARQLMQTRDLATVSIQEITDAADVGFGSFYNHFQTKDELIDAAIEDVFEEHGALMDSVTADLDDPAEVFAAAVRLSARLAKTHPQVASVIHRTGLRYLNAPNGLAPRALRDLLNAKDAGRLQFDDPTVALACVAGALLGVLHLATLNPKPSAIDKASDELALNLLRMFGMPDAEAREIASRKLPKV